MKKKTVLYVSASALFFTHHTPLTPVVAKATTSYTVTQATHVTQPASHQTSIGLQTSLGDGWHKSTHNWIYVVDNQKQTGWKHIHGHWYAFTEAGHMRTGWQRIQGRWYYFFDSGRMATGWQHVGGRGTT